MSTIDPTLQSELRAFPAYPCIKRYFPGRSIEEARQRLSAAIERGDGPGLVIGATGTGKSLLLQALANQFADRFAIAHLSCSQLCSRRALVQAILFELGLPYRSQVEGDLRLTLLDHLVPNERCPNGMLLLVDEAQTLSVRLLEELRLLTNLVRDGRPRVRLVLAGSLPLEEKFAAAELEAFQQRISARSYLAPLGANEIGSYVQGHLDAGGERFAAITFSDEAIHAIYSATDGVPRLVNQICDRVLTEAAVNSGSSINARAIQEAWADFQQLPTPWETEPEALNQTATVDGDASGGNVVEFGELTSTSELDELKLGPEDESPEELELVIPTSESLEATSLGEVESLEVAGEYELEHSGTIQIELPEDKPWLDEDEVQPLVAEVETVAASNPGTTGSVFDEQPQLVGSTTAAKPKEKFKVASKPASNPFEESFAEEEVVLEDFAALGEVLHIGTPRVECRVDQQISKLVQDVACLAEDSVEEAQPQEEAQLEEPEVVVGATANEVSEIAQEQTINLNSVRQEQEEIEPLHTVPLVSLPVELESNHLVNYDPVMPESDSQEECDEQAKLNGDSDSSTLKYPANTLDLDSSQELALGDDGNKAIEDNPSPEENHLAFLMGSDETDEADSLDEVIEPTDLDDEEADILVIEDVPAVASHSVDETVRRQDYRQLFAKLRGT